MLDKTSLPTTTVFSSTQSSSRMRRRCIETRIFVDLFSQVLVYQHSRKRCLQAECHKNPPAKVVPHEAACMCQVVPLATVVSLSDCAGFLSSRTSPRVIYRWKSISGALSCCLCCRLHCPAHVFCSVAQLEELRAECDKELNNARLMGELPAISLILSLCSV